MRQIVEHIDGYIELDNYYNVQTNSIKMEEMLKTSREHNTIEATIFQL